MSNSDLIFCFIQELRRHGKEEQFNTEKAETKRRDGLHGPSSSNPGAPPSPSHPERQIRPLPRGSKGKARDLNPAVYPGSPNNPSMMGHTGRDSSPHSTAHDPEFVEGSSKKRKLSDAFDESPKRTEIVTSPGSPEIEQQKGKKRDNRKLDDNSYKYWTPK